MVTVYDDIEQLTDSELFMLLANPDSLEDRLLPEGMNLVEAQNAGAISQEEVDHLHDIVREKHLNKSALRNVLLKIINSDAFNIDRVGAPIHFENEEQITDYAVNTVFRRYAENVRSPERRRAEAQGRRVRNIDANSTLLRHIAQYQKPRGMQGWKKAARGMEVDVDIIEYLERSACSPLFIQVASKTGESLAEKLGLALARAEANRSPLEEAANTVRDQVKAMIVTPWAYHDAGPHSEFDHPRITESTPDSQSKIVEALIANNAFKIVKHRVRDTYTDPNTINWLQMHVQPTELGGEQLLGYNGSGNAPIRYPRVFRGDEPISLALMSAHGYLDYWLGENSHLRSKMRHEHSSHKDRDKKQLDKEGKKRAERYESNLLAALRPMARMYGGSR